MRSFCQVAASVDGAKDERDPGTECGKAASAGCRLRRRLTRPSPTKEPHCTVGKSWGRARWTKTYNWSTYWAKGSVSPFGSCVRPLIWRRADWTTALALALSGQIWPGKTATGTGAPRTRARRFSCTWKKIWHEELTNCSDWKVPPSSRWHRPVLGGLRAMSPWN